MNPTQLAEFNEKRSALVAKLAEAHDKGDHANFTEYRTQLDNMDAEYEKHEQRSSYLESLKQRATKPAQSVSVPDGVAGQNGREQNPRATEEYRNAFLQFIQTGDRRSVNIVNGPDGQYALAPAQLDPVIVTPAGTASGLRAKINLVTLTGTMNLQGLSVTSRSGGFTKGRQIDLDNDSEASLTMAQRLLTLYPFKTFLKVDNPFIDGGIMADPLGWIGQQLQELKEENEEDLYIYGSGNSEPLGILTVDAQGVPSSKHVETAGASGVMTFQQLVATQYAVKSKWRATSEWYFSKDACIMLDSMKDSQGNPILKESLTADGPVKMLLGSKLNETEAITAAFTSATSGVFADNVLTGFYGDMKRYTAIQPSSAAIKVDRSRLVEKDQTLVIALTWLDGHPIDQEAFGVVKIVN